MTWHNSRWVQPVPRPRQRASRRGPGQAVAVLVAVALSSGGLAGCRPDGSGSTGAARPGSPVAVVPPPEASPGRPAVLRPAPPPPGTQDPGGEAFTASALRRQELLERFTTTAVNVGCHGVNDPEVPPVRVDIDVSADGEILVARVVPLPVAVSAEVAECAAAAAAGLEGTRIDPPGRSVTHRFQRRLAMGAPPPSSDESGPAGLDPGGPDPEEAVPDEPAPGDSGALADPQGRPGDGGSRATPTP